ncbi:MAG: BrnA antitoxin family protein [Chloroflexota bacterium]|nr:BrnA antitoxin family protein [Chloroflexota bacterium]
MQKSGTIVSYTAEEIDEMLARGESQSDWAAADAMTEEELEAAIASDPDEAGLGYQPPNWDNVIIGFPKPKRQLTVRLDSDIIEWFKATGKGYQTRMNAVLRSYVEAEKRQDLERQKRERAETAASGE